MATPVFPAARAAGPHGALHGGRGCLAPARLRIESAIRRCCWDFEAVRDDDHVLAIFRRARGHWGALSAKIQLLPGCATDAAREPV